MEKVAIAGRPGRGQHRFLQRSLRQRDVFTRLGDSLFIDQIKAGKPLTLTMPEMTRFLLPLPDAIELVSFAFRHAHQGDLFIKKAPACTVKILAQALKDLFASDSPLRVIGIRHGEKIYETLATREELARAQDYGRILRVPMDDRDLNYGQVLHGRRHERARAGGLSLS